MNVLGFGEWCEFVNIVFNEWMNEVNETVLHTMYSDIVYLLLCKVGAGDG